MKIEYRKMRDGQGIGLLLWNKQQKPLNPLKEYLTASN